MSALESALDVLSRAATMVQEEGPKSTELHRRPSNAKRKERKMEPVQNEALDMSKGKSVPPTFLRPTVIMSSTSNSARMRNWETFSRPELPSTSAATNSRQAYSIYDSSIEEHFKRSLGEERYAAIFNPTGPEKDVGLSVDDHFAKSLGDQWATLQEPVDRRSTSNYMPVPPGNINTFSPFNCCCPACCFPDPFTSPQ
ncbi:hypothetical protein KPH14_006248 [Odynerus spinipes]|uniref:Transcription cofactor vestigial-like protein 4 n=1 Tax=Odynerus spinipes TaxID=1348599 RepID=A0AAD9RJ02_9HYME|nr:hypothetical protein KPH14_006248 [Odynerus spinipes]